MGKHTPLLLTKKDKIPSAVKRYIKLVKPMIPKDMPSPPFMHGFILGTDQNIGYEAQVMIEDALSIDHEMMDIEHEGHNSDHMCMHHMHHPNHMMDIKNDGHDSDCCMHMNHQHHMADIEHEGHNSDHMCMHHMHHPDHMMDMEHDENEEMNNDYNHKMSNDHRFENLNCNYRRVSIDEILG